MCTAFYMSTKHHYFGRTLDIDRSYGEEVCVMPRRFPLRFKSMGVLEKHIAIIGMATVIEDIPLFYDGVNECGLAMAGLNFPGNACYRPVQEGKDNVASYEFIPWILGQCRTLGEAEKLLMRINLTELPFREDITPAPLHWMIADDTGTMVVEPCRDRLYVHPNPVGILTNNPPFEYQISNVKQYQYLRVDHAPVSRDKDLPYNAESQGLGAVGLPGDVSSMSRFVRGAFGLKHSVCAEDEAASVGQFFHLLSSVEMVRGVCKTDAGTWDITAYSACMNLERGLYYYSTYENRRIICVDMRAVDLECSVLRRFPLLRKESILYQNQ